MAEEEAILMVVRNYLREAEEFVKQAQYDSAITSVEKAIQTARDNDHTPSLAAAYYAKGSVIWSSGGTSEETHLYANLAVQHTKANTRTDLLARTLSARVKAARGNYEAAIYLNEDLLKYYYENEDYQGQADILRSLGDIYRAMGQYDKAHERYFAALSVYNDYEDPINHAGLLLSIGSFMYQQEDYDQARRYWEEARNLASAKGYRHVLKKIDEAMEMLEER